MSEWEKFDPKEAEEVLGPDGIKSAVEHARGTVARTRVLLQANLPSGTLTVARGPIVPVPDGTGRALPPSACPLGYMILWHGHRGEDWPPEVDENVLMRITEGSRKGQMWAVDSAEHAERIIKSAFRLTVKLPTEEAKS